MAHILVADDNVTQLEIQARLLEGGGHRVSLAFCPSEALRLIASAELIIMDLRFRNAQGDPDPQEGLGLIRHIRGSGCTAPVIVVSGWPEELHGSPEQAMVSRVMIKPVRMTVLLAAIQELLT